MFKNKLDYKLLNLVLLSALVFLLYQTNDLWLGLIYKFYQIITPFLISFVLAYAFYPFLKKLESKKVPKSISIFIIIAIILGIFSFVIILVAPLLIGQLSSLFTNILKFFKEISIDYDINVSVIQESLTTSFSNIMGLVSKYISDGAINAINISIQFLTIGFISFSLMVYFLIDMDKIRLSIKSILSKKSIKTYNYVKILDEQMRNYLTGFIRISVITFFEYGIAFYIIGHKNALLLAFLAMIASLIPYFGGMIVNIIASITAFAISPTLFIRTLITFGILSILDSYVINPTVYGKTNKVHPIIVIASVFIGGILFKVPGIIMSLPVAIIIISTYKFFKEDINEKFDDIADSKKIKKTKSKKRGVKDDNKS